MALCLKVRAEIEHLLDDDGDMAEMYLTDKFLRQQLEGRLPPDSPDTFYDPITPTQDDAVTPSDDPESPHAYLEEPSAPHQADLDSDPNVSSRSADYSELTTFVFEYLQCISGLLLQHVF